jgi:uncharacterized protein YgiM (DUF1202 family)
MPEELRPRLVGKVIAARETSYPKPLEVGEGDKLTVGQRDEDWKGFLWCANPTGQGGWVPEDYIEQSGAVGVMRCDYTAKELTITEGEELILHKSQSGWYWATNHAGESGWVPTDHIELVGGA